MTNSTTSGQHILKTYKHRWGTESGYCIVQKYQGRTASKNVVFRVLLRGLKFVLTTIWIRLNVEMRRLGFIRSGISCSLRSTIPYRNIFTANESFLDSSLPMFEVHKDNFLLLITDQLSRIGQSLWR